MATHGLVRWAAIALLMVLLPACSSAPTDSRGDYYCSWETTEEAYQRCMEVSRELDRSRDPAAEE